MNIVKVMLGDLQTNCYIIINEINECVMVDPGAESEKVCELLEERALTLKAILITHGHFDHVGAVKDLQKVFNVATYAHKNESLMMSDSKLNLSSVFSALTIKCEATEFLVDQNNIDLGEGFKFKVIEVPGHTSHSLCFLHSDGHLFSGDTLFKGAVGRTDLYDGHPRDLIKNIKEKLFVLDDHIKVYPGHGMISSIQVEMDTNPFF